MIILCCCSIVLLSCLGYINVIFNYLQHARSRIQIAVFNLFTAASLAMLLNVNLSIVVLLFGLTQVYIEFWMEYLFLNKMRILHYSHNMHLSLKDCTVLVSTSPNTIEYGKPNSIEDERCLAVGFAIFKFSRSIAANAGINMVLTISFTLSYKGRAFYLCTSLNIGTKTKMYMLIKNYHFFLSWLELHRFKTKIHFNEPEQRVCSTVDETKNSFVSIGWDKDITT